MSDVQAPAAAGSAPEGSEGSEAIESQEGNLESQEAAPAELSDAEANELEQQLDAAESNAESKEEVKQIQDLRRKFKLKVDGREEDFDIDLGNEEEVIKQLQLARVAQKRMSEHAMLRKDVEELSRHLTQDPIGLLADLGINVDDLAEQHIARKIEELQKSPEQRHLEELERKVQLAEEKASRQENEKKQEAELRFQQEHATTLNTQIENVIQKYPDLPKTPYTLERIARYMMASVEAGNVDVSVEDVIPYVKRDSDNELKTRIKSIGENNLSLLEDLIGKDILDKMRKQRLSQNKQALQTASQIKPTGQAERKAMEATDDKKKTRKLKDFLRS